MSEKAVTPYKSPFDRGLVRNLCGILLAFITSVIMIPGMATYLPLKLADQIAVPILLFPFIWLGLFLYSYLSKNAWYPVLLMILLSVLHAFLSIRALQGG